MDRSSFNFVGSTNDLEKRQAYKVKLAGQIEPSQPKELLAVDNTFNGVSPGGILVHPSLGEGTLVEVNHDNNEVLIDFGTNGLIGLVLSQARSFVHAPVTGVTKGIAGKDDAFIGSEIQSRTIAPQDRDFRKIDFSKITSPDFVVPEKTFAPVGSAVWHPDLGACTVVSVDEKKNSLTLRTTSDSVIDMVLSQVRSKIREINTSPEHIPMQPLVREQLAQQVPQYKSRGDVSVSLPDVFKTWKKEQQFMFLTRSQSLTTEQANDVFSVIAGGTPMFHSVSVTWQSQEDIAANFTGGPDTRTELKGRVLPEHSILQNKNLWHPDFGECQVHSVDTEGNSLILQTSVGHVPFVMDAVLSSLAVLTASAPEHAPKRLAPTRVLVTSDTPVSERPKIVVDLPEVFVTWRAVDQYQFLTVSRHLIPEHANDIMASVAGTLHSSPTEYEIQWTDELPESNKRSDFKDQLLKRIEAASVEQELPAPPAPVDPGTRRFIEKVDISKKVSIFKVSVDLPTDFKSWTSSGQYVFLTRSRQLTFNEANDVMDTLQGKTLKTSTKYELNWNDSDPVAYAAMDSGVRRVTEEVETVEKQSVLKKIAVTLPPEFKAWSNSKQYEFLTRARRLTIDESNSVLNKLQNKSFNTKIEYEIIWSE